MALVMIGASIAGLALGTWLVEPIFGAVPPELAELIDWLRWGGLAFAMLVLSASWLRWPGASTAVEIDAESIVLPRLLGGLRRVPLADVTAANLVADDSGFVLASRGRLPSRIFPARFAAPGDPAGLLEALRSAIAQLPEGRDQLARLDRCDAAAVLVEHRRPIATWTLLAAMGLGFGLQTALGSPGDLLQLFRLGGNVPDRVLSGEVERVLLAAFLHTNATHLLFNGAALLLVGSLLERLIGWRRFSLVAFAGAIAGGAASAGFGTHEISVGASTAVHGVMGGIAAVVVRFREQLPAALQLPVSTWLLAALQALLGEAVFPALDHFAHAGGFAGGLFMGAATSKNPQLTEVYRSPSRRIDWALAVCGAVCVAALTVGALRMGRLSAMPSTAQATQVLVGAERTPTLVNQAAWHIATAAEANTDELARALEACEAVAAGTTPAAAITDTIATLLFRLGRLDEAIRLELALADRISDVWYGSQLARFEWSRVQRDGLRTRATHPPVDIHLSRAADKSIDIELTGGDPSAAFRVHAAILRNGQLWGHVRLRFGPNKPARVSIRAEEMPGHLQPNDELRTTAIEAITQSPAAGEFRWTMTAIDPAVLALP